MTVLAIDALDTGIPPAAIKAAGYIGVLHYLRVLTAARCQDLLAAGLGVGTIFETNAAESLGGAAAGQRDGALAAQQMVQLGQPPGTLHAVNLADFKPTSLQIPIIQSYYAAYRSQTMAWQVIPYGTGFVLNNLSGLGWQNAMDDNGVPGSVVVHSAALYQRTQPTLTIPNASYDENVVIAPVNWWVKGIPIHMASAALPPGVKVVNVAVCGDAQNKIDLFMVGDDGNVYHKWYTNAWMGYDVPNHAI